jgi:hypothetical protein
MTGRLILAPKLQDADRFYADFVQAHASLSDQASALLNARLVLILANHIGDSAVLDQALRLAAARLPMHARDQEGTASEGAAAPPQEETT